MLNSNKRFWVKTAQSLETRMYKTPATREWNDDTNRWSDVVFAGQNAGCTEKFYDRMD